MPIIIDLLFGCTHPNYTFPQTHRCRISGKKQPMHVVCLDCGSEAAYDFRKMRPDWRQRSTRPTQAIHHGLQSTRAIENR
ncbi:MAG TPA: hypothetical protein VNW97_16745 [Candidatus Saccharimonadales bacterium]|nr:hypothetical protein [Candidatus Saccharimonadales bacterium]